MREPKHEGDAVGWAEQREAHRRDDRWRGPKLRDLLVGFALLSPPYDLLAQDKTAALQRRFDADVQPFLKSNCHHCHNAEKRKGDVVLHDVTVAPTDVKMVARWLQVLEQVECHFMPPEGRTQPPARQRQNVVDWIADFADVAGKGFELRVKKQLPEYGNRVNHDLLFDGSIPDLPSSPPRLWRISPFIYAGKGYQTTPGPKAEPLAYSTKTDGIRDYSSQEIVGEAGFLSLMMTFDDILTKRLHDDPSLKSLAQGKEPPAKDAMEKVIRDEFQKATSRPIEDDELARYVAFMTNNVKQAGNESGVKLAIMAIYLTPEAIYRMELGLGAADAHGRRILSPRELGFAISYALTDQPPSKVPTIREALEKKQLSTKDDVERIVRKMLTDGSPPTQLGLPGYYDALRAQGKRGYGYYPRVLRFFEEFFEYPRSGSVFKDAKRGTFGPRAVPGVMQGTIMAIVNEDKNVIEELLASPKFNDSRARAIELLDAQHQARLKSANDKQKEDLTKQFEKKVAEIKSRPKDENFRAGALTDPSWLMVHAKCVANDPVKRGKWVRERLLVGNIPELPIGVEAKIPEDHDKTLRERFSVVEAEQCWKCHKHMNPLGMPFEIFDDFGRHRTGLYYHPKRKEFLEEPEWERIAKNKDAAKEIVKHDVDATGVLSGSGDPALDGDVKDAIDLVQRLAKSPRVRQSIVRHAFRYWMGRNETLGDSKTLIAAEQAYVRSGGKFSEIIVSLLTSDSFLYRR